MAKFVYSMQSVLNLKIKTENQSKMEFGVAQMHLNEELDKMESLQRRLEDYLFQGEELQKSILDVNEILFNRNAVENVKAQIEDQKLNIERAEKVVDEARIKLSKDMQERKMQETLRERAYQEYLQEEKDAEFKDSDQRTSFTYGQRISDRKNKENNAQGR